MSESLYAREDFLDCFRRWWSNLSGQPLDEEGEAFAPDTKYRAQLRHAKGVLDVCMSEAFGRGLLGALRERGIVPSLGEMDGLARLAGLAAHVKTMVANRQMAGIMAQPKSGGSKACVSPQRFRKFLMVEDLGEFYTAMLRLLRMTDGVGNLKSLARACFDWNDTTRRWWAMEYYNALPKDENEQ